MSHKSVRNSKRSRRKVVLSIEEKDDRISELPDELILHILSFLDAKDAVRKDAGRSGFLSKRFSYLWTNLACLHFKESSFKFINSTLLNHNLSNLVTVSVMGCFSDNENPDHKNEFDRVIWVPNLANVKELTLDFHGEYSFRLPQHLYLNPSLKKLALTGCDIKPNVLVKWKSLQSLCVTLSDLSDDAISNILSGCPFLEFLKLSLCSTFTRIDAISNRCLRKLVITEYCDEQEHNTVEISAPNLQSLVLLSDMDCFKWKVSNMLCLTDCHLDFYNIFWWTNKGDMIISMKSLLHGLSHVELVTIGEWIIQGLSEFELNGLSCPMPKSVKYLILETNLTTVDMPGIACLLRGLTCLEKLIINKKDIPSPWNPRDDIASHETKNYRTSENVKTGFNLKLKFIKICGLEANEDLLYDQNEELELVEFLMKNAKLMEHITIGANGSKACLLELTKKLMSFPRSSPRAEIKILRLEHKI